MSRVCIETYGCSNNIAESKIMEKLLVESGFTLVDMDHADVVIVNTCSVKSVTENKILHQLRRIAHDRPEQKIIITGCMPEAEYEIIKEVAPTAGLLSTHHIDEIVSVVEQSLKGEYVEILGKQRLDKAVLPRQRINSTIDIVPIARGCTSFCTFCSTKEAKGDLFSFS